MKAVTRISKFPTWDPARKYSLTRYPVKNTILNADFRAGSKNRLRVVFFYFLSQTKNKNPKNSAFSSGRGSKTWKQSDPLRIPVPNQNEGKLASKDLVRIKMAKISLISYQTLDISLICEIKKKKAFLRI